MKITIEKSDKNDWTVKMEDRTANRLGWDEMLGLISALTMPVERGCLQWMETAKTTRAKERYMKNLTRRTTLLKELH